MDIEKTLAEILAQKDENKEIAIFYNPESIQPWVVEIGDAFFTECPSECIGEKNASAGGDTIDSAIAELKKKVMTTVSDYNLTWEPLLDE
jgi:hypothetical protein